MHNIVSSVVLVFFVMATGIGIAGVWYYAVQRERAKLNNGSQLSAIAALKADEISRWREERLADARIVIDTPFIAQLVRQCFEHPLEPHPMQEMLKWMESYKDQYDYYSVSLLNVEGTIRLSIPEGEQTDEELLKRFSEVMHTKRPYLCDLEQSETVTVPHLDLIIPIFITGEGDGAPPVGALLLRIDPHEFLFRLMQLWPTPSPTGETLLARREGSEVVFLSHLRHQENIPLSMRLPLSNLKVPAVMASQGYEGIVEGIDYRGFPVLAAINHLPDVAWFVIAKIDADEIYAPIRERALLIAFLLTLLIAGAGLTLGLIWSNQRSQLYLKQYKTEAEKLEIARRYEHLTRHANDIILLVREDEKIVEANYRALATYGYESEEILGLKVRDLEMAETLSTFEERMRLAREQDGFVFETMHRRRNGTGFPVEISTRPVKLMEGNLYLQIVRDISERKQAEKELQEAHDTLELRVQERTADLLVLNERLNQEMQVRVRAEEELRAVTVRLAETEEAERRRLARELHDRVGQNLTALNFNIATVMNLLPAELHENMMKPLGDSLNLVEETVACVRNVMADLRPPLLDDYGLGAVLCGYCREFSQRSGIATFVKCEGYTPRLPLSVEIALFRIAQEALVNVLRHARASQVTLELQATVEVVRMSIADDGVGCNHKGTSSPRTQHSGWGMLSMRERAEMVGGCLRVDSGPAGGARITVEVKR